MPSTIKNGIIAAINVSPDGMTFITMGGMNKGAISAKNNVLDASFFAQGDDAMHNFGGLPDGSLSIGGDWLSGDPGQAQLLSRILDGGDLYTQLLSDGVLGYKVKGLLSQLALKGTTTGKVTVDGTIEFNGQPTTVTDSIHHSASQHSPIAGHFATLKTDIAPVTMAAEACVQVGTSQTYRISSAAHEILDPRTAVVVKDSGTAVAAASIAMIDFLFGKVTFVAGYTPTGAITIDGKYIPTVTVLTATEFSVTAKRAMLDKTALGSAWMEKLSGPLSVDLSFKSLAEPTDEYSTGLSMWADFNAATPKLAQIDLNGAGTAGVIRSWQIYSGLTKDIAFGGIQSSSLTGVLARMQPTHPTAIAYRTAFSIDTP